MTYSFNTTLDTDGFMGALIIPENIVKQLTDKKIKRVMATVKANDNEVTMHAGVLKRKGVHYIMFSKAKKSF